MIGFNDKQHFGAIKCPCHHCDKRTLTCDSTCEAYKHYKEQIAQYHYNEKHREVK